MTAQQQYRLRAKISLALLEELGRRPTADEVEKYSRLARVLYKAVLGTHFERQQQKQSGQLAIF